MNESESQPIPNTTLVQETAHENTPSVQPSQQKSDKKIIIFLTLALITTLGAFGFLAYKTSYKTTDSIQNEGEIEPVIKTELPSSPDPKKRILFTKNPDREIVNDLQTWIMNPDGTDQKRLDINISQYAYKWPEDNKIFYTKSNQENEFINDFYIKDLASDFETKLDFIKHPDENVIENISVNGLKYISPDFSVLIYNVFFSVPCPTPEPGNENLQGGSGPCTPEPREDIKDGNYLYDIATGKSFYLENDFTTVSRWDLENNALYIKTGAYQKDGLDKIDLKTKQITRVKMLVLLGTMSTHLQKLINH